MKKCFLYGLLPVVIMNSCSIQESQVEYNADIRVEMAPEENVLHFSDIYDRYECIYLSGSLISHINDVIVREDGFIVKGKSDDVAIAFFSRDGKYVCPIVRIGRGPGELTDIQAMVYNPYTETLDVLGNIGSTVIKYDCKTFKEKASFSIRHTDIMSARDFCPIDADRYMFYKDYSVLSRQEYFLYVFNSASSQIEDTYLPMDKRLAEMLSFGQRNNLYLKDGTVYFYAAFQKYIYQYVNSEFSGYIEFTPGKYMALDKLLEKKYNDVIKFVTKVCQPSPYIWAHINVFSYRDMILSSYTYKNEIYNNVIYVEDGSSHSYKFLEDDMVWGIRTEDLRSMYNLTGTDSRYVVYIVEPFTLKEEMNRQPYSGTDADIIANRNVLNALPDDANPIILLMEQEK